MSDVTVWDISTGKCVTFNHPSGPCKDEASWCLFWSQDNRRIASEHRLTIVIHDSTTGVRLGILDHTQMLENPAKDPRPTLLASICQSKRFFDILDLITPKYPKTMESSTYNIGFHKIDQGDLHTSLGMFKLEPTDGSIHGASRVDHLPQEGYGLSEDMSWITWNGKRILWLPSDYRPTARSAFPQKMYQEQP
ncbi:hypothetical protein BO71DRAFT_432463 [Aspergillus ellipticus CBS 707.79]|uniref:Uncharacterized protein n=1 Tax=Aspergillus ellipticus CBS 707.79 TaxID=1448320 RepID=A0A319ELN2_9EURO|nr:hypothetical protein BO71DRAFT_432463 [Aspergillus ellipticus CBS 707.79]